METRYDILHEKMGGIKFKSYYVVWKLCGRTNDNKQRNRLNRTM